MGLRRQSFGFARVVPVMLALVLTALPAVGEVADTDRETAFVSEFKETQAKHADGSNAQAGGPSALGASWLSKLRIFGFLTQAYATANFFEGGTNSPTDDEQALGIPEDGTFDYRSLALQFRYEMTPKDVMVIQLSSRALGFSPTTDLEDEIELDWAFYEHRFTDHTRLKVGRVQIPIGIYNEIRDVGTVLPFYRPPFVFYREGAFTSETVDGLLIGHRFFPNSSWNLDFDVYFGEWDLVESDPAVGVALARTKDSYGFQTWLNTPIIGLRFGLGGNNRKTTGGLFRAEEETSELDEFYVSVDAAFDRVVFRAEYKEFEPSIDFPAFSVDVLIATYYAQLGFNITDSFQVWLQGEIATAEPTSASFLGSVNRNDREDYGIALDYLFSSNIVLKLEHHLVEREEQRLEGPIFTPNGVRFRPFLVSLEGGDYSIISLSVSF